MLSTENGDDVERVAVGQANVDEEGRIGASMNGFERLTSAPDSRGISVPAKGSPKGAAECDVFVSDQIKWARTPFLARWCHRDRTVPARWEYVLYVIAEIDASGRRLASPDAPW
jgi:hypothetical protein